MKPHCDIKFITTRSKGDLNEGKTCYQGHLQHNAVLSRKETLEAFAEYCREPQSHTSRYIDALGEFIVREVARGNRLNFGSFAVEMKMVGGFKAANSPFDWDENAIRVHLIPDKKIKQATGALKPINVTEDVRWYIGSTRQRTPYEVFDHIVAEGLRTSTVCGYFPVVKSSRPDEGVWIENDTNEKVLVATVTKSEFGRAECTFEGPLAIGDYWVVTQSRYRDEPNLIRCRRRIKVV